MTKEVKQAFFSGIDELKKRYSVEWLCEMFCVSRSGYYKWLKRKGIDNSYEKFRSDLDGLVLPIYRKHPSLGYRSIRDRILKTTGWIVCDLSVYRSMVRLGIKALPRQPKYHYYSEGTTHKEIPNVLASNFTATKPFEKIVTDITVLMNRGQRYYLSLYIDLYNNSIVAWDYKLRQDNYIVINPLKALLKMKSIDTPLLLHSDQGGQYSSLGYRNLLKTYNVTQSMSRAGTPRDNAVAESLIGRIKEVLYYDYKFKRVDNPREVLSEAIMYFNYERPSYALEYKTPAQFTIEQGHSFLCLQTID